MKYFYGEYDGEEFPTQDKLFGFDQLMQFIMEHGEQALKAIEQMMNDPKNEAQSDMLEQLLKDGMLDKDGQGRLRLTPRAVTKMQRKALMEVFANLRMASAKVTRTHHPGPRRRTHRGNQALPIWRSRQPNSISIKPFTTPCRVKACRHDPANKAAQHPIRSKRISSCICTRASPVAPPSCCWT